MSISNGGAIVGASSILAALSGFLSSGTCFANRLRTFALRMFGIRPYLKADLIMLATLGTIRNTEMDPDYQVVGARGCFNAGDTR